MPKQTFFGLPEEKKKRILDAARQEFMTVPYSEASINRIIKNAEIPRGSFYQYFEDKEDVFFYCMGQHAKLVYDIVARGLDEHQGNLFATLHDFADRLLEIAYHGANPKVKAILSDPWVCQVMWNGIVTPGQREQHLQAVQEYTSEIWDHVEARQLDLAEGETEHFGCILGCVLRDSIQQLFLRETRRTEEAAAAEIHGRIRSLERHYSR